MDNPATLGELIAGFGAVVSAVTGMLGFVWRTMMRRLDRTSDLLTKYRHEVDGRLDSRYASQDRVADLARRVDHVERMVDRLYAPCAPSPQPIPGDGD